MRTLSLILTKISELRKISILYEYHAITILSLVRKIFRLLYFFNAMNTGWNVAVLLYIYAIGFRMFYQKEKNFVLTKCKQKICNTKEKREKKLKQLLFCQKEKNFVLTK